MLICLSGLFRWCAGPISAATTSTTLAAVLPGMRQPGTARLAAAAGNPDPLHALLETIDTLIGI
jgi:hypothetical protein